MSEGSMIGRNEAQAFDRVGALVPALDAFQAASLSPKEIDERWLDESERRMRELDAGHTQLVPGEDVYRKAQILLK